MERITRLSNNSNDLRYAERRKCRLIDYRCDRQSVVSLESCNGLSGHRAKDAIDRSVIVTVALQLFLNIDNYLVRGQSIVAVDWAVVRIIRIRGITPCREPVARIPIIPAAVYKHDPIVMAAPPTTIVPLPVVIAEGRILLTAESGTVEVIINRHIASTIIGEVPCAVDRDVPIPIHRYVVASAKLVHVAINHCAVAGAKLVHVSITINLNVLRAVRREVSLAINRYAVASANVGVSCPIRRHVSLAVDGDIVSRAKLLIP